MGYTTFKPLGSWGVYDFPICVCFARCCRRSGSILFCTRVTTGIFTMSSVSSLSLSQYSFLFYFSCSFTPFSSLPHCSSSSFFWYDVLDVWNYFSLIDILYATKEMERKKKDVSLFSTWRWHTSLQFTDIESENESVAGQHKFYKDSNKFTSSCLLL
jgi:hypothetical protein